MAGCGKGERRAGKDGRWGSTSNLVIAGGVQIRKQCSWRSVSIETPSIVVSICCETLGLSVALGLCAL